MKNSIKNIYYRIWVDAIKAAIKTDKNGDNNWKTVSILTFSVAQGINILTIFFLIKLIFKMEFQIFIDFNVFPGNMLDGFLSSFVTLFLPFIIINYFLIFHKSKYKTLLNKYDGFKMKGGLAMVLYFTISMLIFLLPIIIGKWIV